MHEKNLHINLLLDYYGDTLTERQREVMDLYYNEDMSLFEISEHVDVTRQGVHDLIKRSELSLLELDEKLGFVKRFEDIRRAAQDIAAALDIIEKGSLSSDAAIAVEKIRKALSVIEPADDAESEV